MKMSANPLQACLDILISPAVAFDTIKEKKGWSWLPFVLLISSTLALFMYYFNTVDFAWLKETMLNQAAASKPMTDDELKAVAMFYEKVVDGQGKSRDRFSRIGALDPDS